MITVDICMETVFEDLPYIERPARIADAGFDAVELWFPEVRLEGLDLSGLRTACDGAGVRIVSIVANSPDGSIGGSLTDPADRPKYLARLSAALHRAAELGASIMITCTGNAQPHLPLRAQRQSIVDGLRAAGDLAARTGTTLVLEPLNSLVDHPGYFLDQPDAAAEIVREVAHPHVALLFDIYHMQIMRGNVIETIRTNIDIIRHFHAAGVPGRHELDSGELAYPPILDAIQASGYHGCFGLEYYPIETSGRSLARMRRLLPDRPEQGR
ncbi:MAG: TIM barrel protein [Planctomycetes bacterium]|nr:TIM barrel protein [Planctomycetota bacterium]